LIETARDLHEVVDYLERRKDLGVTAVGAAGYSMGGSAALLGLTLDRRIATAASICGTGCDFLAGATNTAYAARQGWNTDVRNPPDPNFADDCQRYDPLLHPTRFQHRPILFLGNRHDRIAPPDGVVRLFAKLRETYGPDSDRLVFLLDSPEPSNAAAADPMLSHLPDLKKLALVDEFLDRHLLRKATD